MKWEKEAEEAMKRVPVFVRRMVKRRVEEEAKKRGARRVALSHVTETRRRFLNRMEEEVRGYRVDTCFGPSGCPNRAIQDNTIADEIELLLRKRDLKEFLKAKVSGALKLHHEFHVSISDCPNACSRPQIVDFGLIGASKPIISDEPCSECGKCVAICKESAINVEEAKPEILVDSCLLCGACIRVCPTGTIQESEKGYRILLGGKLGRHPRLALEIPGIYGAKESLIALERCLDFYQENCKGGERLGAILDVDGEQELVWRMRRLIDLEKKSQEK